MGFVNVKFEKKTEGRTVYVEYSGVFHFMDFVRQMVLVYDDTELIGVEQKVVDLRLCRFKLSPHEWRMLAYILRKQFEKQHTCKLIYRYKKGEEQSGINILAMECKSMGVEFQAVES
jgi:hypothetical protein